MNWETPTVNELVPQFLREDYQDFIKFMQEYSRYLNDDKNPSYVINRLIDEHDLDRVFDEDYINRLKFEVANYIPFSPYSDKLFFLKYLPEFLKQKGTEPSFKHYFKIFFDEDVEIEKPWDNVFKTSSTIWKSVSGLRIVLYRGSPEELKDSYIVQKSASGEEVGRALVEDVLPRHFQNKIYYECILNKSSISGGFVTTLEVETLDGICKGNVVRSFADLKIESGGINYEVNDKIYIQNKDNITFQARVTGVNPINGEIIRVEVEDFGESKSIHYRDDLVLEDVTSANPVNVYLSGILNESSGLYSISDIDVRPYNTDRTDLSLYVDKDVSVIGILAKGVLFVTSISQNFLDDSDLHDFEYYQSDAYDELTLNSSTDYQEISGLVIETESGTGASLTGKFNALIDIESFNLNTSGHLSDYSSILMDSFYWQLFAYVVKTELQLKEWIDDYTQIVHPAGVQVFGEIEKNFVGDIGANITGTLESVQIS